METAAFIAANLSFGRREQIISHVEYILEQSPSPYRWILDGGYKKIFDGSDKSFYRMFSFKTMRIFFETLQSILKKNETLGTYFKNLFLQNQNPDEHLCKIIARPFPDECKIIPRTKSSASKRLNMFLRWMVRDSSPVDLGLWTWFDKKNLLMPLDTHVIQQSVKFGLLKSTKNSQPAPTMKNAHALTDFMKTVFPDDPVRGDFALFGLGVNSV